MKKIELSDEIKAIIEANWSIKALRQAQIEEKVTAVQIVEYSILKMKEHLDLCILADVNCLQALTLAEEADQLLTSFKAED